MIKETLEKFKKKVTELRVSRDGLIDTGESKICEFGYKIKVGNEIFTVTDWGNIERFILTSHISYLDEKIKEIKEFRHEHRNKPVSSEFDIAFDDFINSLQKEKVEAEEELKKL